MPLSEVSVRTQFFEYLFSDEVGYLCIATASPTAMHTSFDHTYFEWPIEKDAATEFIQQKQINHHVWFCVSLLKTDAFGCIKEQCLPGSFLWSDLDEVTPDDLQIKSVPAPCVVETSPERYQAFWRLSDKLIPPDVREDLSRKLTYYVGADKGGWACNKLMRVPFTINHKYSNKPQVNLLQAYETLAPISVFEGLPDPPLTGDAIPLPDQPSITELASPENIIYKYSYNLHNTGFADLYTKDPTAEDDWSKRMWRMLLICFEAGMEADEVFSLALEARCNKYKRDNRPISYLWREVIKAKAHKTKSITLLGEYKPLVMPDLVDIDLERSSFVTEYSSWAAKATDAVEAYHDLCAFILLSATLSSGLKLRTSFGKLVPNLWGLVLGDSTLTRKTTAMDMAMDFLREIDKESIVATDGSPEGLITVLGQRPEQVSVYLKDEVSGLFNAMNTKSYLSDLPELLTKMYDVPEHYTRALRKETINVSSPFFIFFGGGIREKVLSLIDDHYVLSGFMPRFLVVMGYADLTKLRPTGPPDDSNIRGRDNLQTKLQNVYNAFCTPIPSKLGSQVVMIPQTTEATMEAKGWELFAEYEMKLTKAANDSANKLMALPTFTRLAFSGLKMAVLLAASRGPDDARRVTVTVDDLQQAFWYIQDWGRHSIDLIENAGISKTERWIEKICTTIKNHPGCTKTYLMRVHKLSSREMTDVLQTIFDRGLIETKKEGKGLKFWLVSD